MAFMRVFSYYLSNFKSCRKLALGKNSIKIIRDKSVSVAMFLLIQMNSLSLITMFFTDP